MPRLLICSIRPMQQSQHRVKKSSVPTSKLYSTVFVLRVAAFCLSSIYYPAPLLCQRCKQLVLNSFICSERLLILRRRHCSCFNSGSTDVSIIQNCSQSAVAAVVQSHPSFFMFGAWNTSILFVRWIVSS